MPPHVHTPGRAFDLPSDLPSDLRSDPASADPGDGIPEASDRVRCESRSMRSAASSATLPRLEAPSAREAPSGRADPVPAVGSG